MGGNLVHMRGSKLPKPCCALIWLEGKQAHCLAPSGFLCDFPDGGGHTCDRALCEAHAHQVGKNRHYCPEHQADAIASTPQRGLFTGLLQAQE
jgi:hypothetical protein